jgi:uncharacterized membrane protein YtjA (UPF0391 family)
LIAALLGFGGLAGSFVGIARILCYLFLVLTVLAFAATALKRAK